MSAQALAALSRANEIRSKRADLKRSLSTMEILFKDIDFDDPDIQGMRVSELLRALPWKNGPRTGKQSNHPYNSKVSKYRQILASLQMNNDIRVNQLADFRLEALKDMVALRCPSQRES